MRRSLSQSWPRAAGSEHRGARRAGTGLSAVSEGFAFPVEGRSDVEFADDETAAFDTEHEVFATRGGLVSLRELAEEELLLALPIAPVCSTPLTCGNVPDVADPVEPERSDEMRRTFSALQDLLKKR